MRMGRDGTGRTRVGWKGGGCGHGCRETPARTLSPSALAPPADRHPRAVLLPPDLPDREELHVFGALSPLAPSQLRDLERAPHPPSLLGNPAVDHGGLRSTRLARAAMAPPPGAGLRRRARAHVGRVRVVAAAGRPLLAARRTRKPGSGGRGGPRPRSHGRRRAILARGHP